MKVAVTGGVGSGKSVVCRIFSECGFFAISTDELARDAVRPGTSAYRKVIKKFGKSVMLENKALNRKKLREIITEDTGAKRKLEEILHPEILRIMNRRISEKLKTGKSVVVEIPLLFELNLENQFDFVVTVCSRKETRIGRLTARDGISREAAQKLIRIQMPEEEKAKRSHFVIRNDGSIDRLEKDTRIVCKRILAEECFDE